MGFCCEGEIWIPQEEWCEFVMQFLPKSHAETQIGPVRFESGEMVVQYAQNTECHPTQQTVPPSWMKKPAALEGE
jgi:hypothetical protein